MGLEKLLMAMKDSKFSLARDLEVAGREPEMVRTLRTEGYLINTILWLMNDEEELREFCKIYKVAV